MPGPYVFSPNLWLNHVICLFLICLSVYAWRRRSVPGAVWFACGAFCSALWVSGMVLEDAAVAMGAKIFWIKFQAVLQLPATTCTTCFVLDYTWPGRGLTRRRLALFSIAPVLALALALTDDWHHLSWAGFVVKNGAVAPQLGTAFLVLMVYGFLLGILNIAALGWLFFHSPQTRWLIALILMGQIGARGVYFLDRFINAPHFKQLDALIVGYVFLMFAIALFTFRIFNPIALARARVIAQMREGMLVLDPQGRVAGLNPSAQAILGAPEKKILGCRVQDLLPVSAGPIEPLQPGGAAQGGAAQGGAAQIEIQLGDGPGARAFLLTNSTLRDLRGLVAGRLLMLYDVTEQKQSQAKIIEQQRVLATLTERERMARELHDSIGQVLGYAGFQVEAAARQTRLGQTEAAAEQLDRLGCVIHEAHADLREVILNLRTAPSLQQPFFSVVQQYLDGYTHNYQIAATLQVAGGLDDQTFSPDEQLQVFRVLQEALSNARKHGCARRVQVIFERVDGQVCLLVQDDGAGFAPEQVGQDGAAHYGLQFMRERAAQMGGSLQILSAPGAGAQVRLAFPNRKG